MGAASVDPELLERLAELGWQGPGFATPPMTRLAAYGLAWRMERVLLCRVAPGHLGSGLWTLPGGGLAFGESPEVAAIREIEDHLSTHPAILEAAVVGVPDPEWGESLRAFIVLREHQRLSENEVIEYCREHLADYKRPRKVTFVAELPRNPTGKILKQELRLRFG